MEVKQEPLAGSPVRCPACDAVFPSQQWLTVHEKTYHNVKWFECELCDRKARTEDELQKHVNNKHKKAVESLVVVEGGVVECLPATPPLSPSLVGSSDDGEEKGAEKKGEGSQCETCQNILPNKQWLKIHMKKIHNAQSLEGSDKDADHNEALEKLKEYEDMKRVFDALQARLQTFEEHFISGKKTLDYNHEDAQRHDNIKDEFHMEGEPCENNLFKYLGLNPSASSSEDASDDAGGDNDDSNFSDESSLEKSKYVNQFFPAPPPSHKKKKSKLREEDWKDDLSLPMGWKSLEKSSSDGKNLTYFRSPEGATFPSRKAVVAAMVQGGEKYTAEQVRLAERGLEDTYKWNNKDSTIPMGWKSRTIKCSGTNQVKTFFLSPEGKQFQSRKAVHQYMLEDGGFSANDLELVAKGLEKRGFKWISNDPTVPVGWKTRNVEIQGPNGPMTKNYFLAPNGKMFMSRKSALQHMLEDGSYDPKDINIMKRAPVTTKKKSYKIEFMDNDPSVPPGWKVAQKQQILSGKQTYSTCYLCPRGKFFYNRHTALKYMIEDGVFDQKDIQLMKASLEGEGWRLDEKLLPSGWYVKELEKVVKGDLIIDSHYLTEHFELFKSTKAVLLYMSESGRYTSDQIRDVEARFSVAMKRFTEKRHVWQSSESDPTVPTGWKTRRLNTKETQRKAFLSPDGIQFFGRRAAIDHMIQHQYAQGNIDLMRENLIESGWYKDPSLLPPGWMVINSMAKGRVQKSYLSPANVKFRGISGVLKHMKEDGSYSAEEVEKVEAKVIENERIKGESLRAWQDRSIDQDKTGKVNKRKNSMYLNEEVHNEGPPKKKVKSDGKTSNLEEQIDKLKKMANVDEDEIDWIKKEIDTQETGYDVDNKLMINDDEDEDEEREVETPNSVAHMAQISFLNDNPKRKTPQQMSKGQLDILLAEFNVSTRPSPETVQRLSVQTKLTPKRVRKWFDNRKRRMGITCNGGSGSVPLSLSPLASAIPIEITPTVTNTPKPVSIRPKPDQTLTPIQVDALNSALNSYKFLPRTTTDKLVEETGIKRHMVEKWFDENMEEGEDAMERWEARSRLLETIEQPAKDTPAKTNRVIQFLDLEDAEEIGEVVNDAVEIGGEEEEEEIDDDEEEEIELPDEEMLDEDEKEESVSWSNDVDDTIDSFFGGHSVFGSNELSLKEEKKVNTSNLDNSLNGGNKNKMAQVHLDVLIPYFEEFPQPTTEQKLELAEQTGLTKQVIQRWFDNRRRRFRK